MKKILIIAGNAALDQFIEKNNEGHEKIKEKNIVLKAGGCAVNSAWAAFETLPGHEKITGFEIILITPIGSDENSQKFQKLFSCRANQIKKSSLEDHFILKAEFQKHTGPMVKVEYQMVGTEYTSTTCTPFINSSFKAGPIIEQIKKIREKSSQNDSVANGPETEISVTLMLAGTAFMPGLNTSEFIEELGNLKKSSLIDCIVLSLGGRGPFLKEFERLAEVSDIAFVNHTEAKDIFNIDCAARECMPPEGILKGTDKILVITRGEQGVILLTSDLTIAVPPVEISKDNIPENTVGAGDFFAGAFTAEYIRRYSDDLLKDTETLKEILVNASRRAQKNIDSPLTPTPAW